MVSLGFLNQLRHERSEPVCKRQGRQALVDESDGYNSSSITRNS